MHPLTHLLKKPFQTFEALHMSASTILSKSIFPTIVQGQKTRTGVQVIGFPSGLLAFHFLNFKFDQSSRHPYTAYREVTKLHRRSQYS